MFVCTGWFSCVCVCVYIYHIIVHTDHIMMAHEHLEAPAQRIHSHSSCAEPELPLHHTPFIPLSFVPFISLLIPLSNPSLSFYLRSNNISNPYSQPAIPPMAISATALEIFNTLYVQFGWVILKKFFWGGRDRACDITWAHDAYWLLCLLFSFFFFYYLSSLPLSVTDEQTNPGEASRQWESRRYCMLVLPSSFPPPLLATFLLLF